MIDLLISRYSAVDLAAKECIRDSWETEVCISSAVESRLSEPELAAIFVTQKFNCWVY